MGISVGSFAIAGGLILLVLSIKYRSTGRMVEMIKEEMVAVVPIGMLHMMLFTREEKTNKICLYGKIERRN